MPELLIVGGLTIDRFADGSLAPGGSVLHAGRAAVADGVRPRFLTVAGDEPEARAGLASLADMGEVDRCSADATTIYAHHESDGRRTLVYEQAGGAIAADGLVERPGVTFDAALLAPIADELPAAALDDLAASVRPRLSVLLIQGWLRHLVVGDPVRPVGLDEVDAATWAAFGAADAIVVSTEDLALAPGDPFAQAAELREHLGPRPLLVLTLGPHGYLLDDRAAPAVVAYVPRRVVRGVATVGAGDTFGAALALGLAAGRPLPEAAAHATDRVIALLESRRS